MWMAFSLKQKIDGVQSAPNSPKSITFGELKRMMIERTIKNTISSRLFKGKTIILIGARQVGKTTLII